MNDEKDPLLLDHEADGIRELDNNLPRWWVWLFILSTVFAFFYFGYYHVLGVGLTSDEAWRRENEAGNQLKQVALAKFEAEMGSIAPSTDELVLNDGQVIYANLCAPCHLLDGGGLVGPNLTDDAWIHGSEFVDNLRTVYNGVPEKGMVTWKDVLNPEQIKAVTSYIYTLRGTTPANPKPPESATSGGAAAPAEDLYE